jgi:hypothetical protein
MKRLCIAIIGWACLLFMVPVASPQSVFNVSASGAGTATTNFNHFRNTFDTTDDITYITGIQHQGRFRAINSAGAFEFGTAIGAQVTTSTQFSIATNPAMPVHNVSWAERAGVTGIAINAQSPDTQSSYEAAAWGGYFNGTDVDMFSSQSVTTVIVPQFNYTIGIENGVGNMGFAFAHTRIENGETMASTFQQTYMTGTYNVFGSVTWKPFE